MTIDISNNNPRISYSVASGVTQTSFAIPFEFFDDGDVVVYVDDTEKTYGSDYTISGQTLNLSVTGASGGSNVVIVRHVPLERNTDFIAGQDINRAALNEQLDTIVAQIADLDDKVDRTIHLTDSEVPPSMLLTSDRKGRVLAFNSSTGDVEAGPTISDVQSVSDAAADIQTLAHIEDGTDATDAIQTVAGISANVATVANISSNVTTVAGNTSNINAVAADDADIGTVAADIANVNTVAGISANVTTVATNIADVTSVADNMAEVLTADTNAATATTKAAEASASATAAAASETAASTSESNAATSATNASSSASAAATSATSAQTAQTAAETAQAAAELAEDNAEIREQNATTSALNAATYAQNAATSATAASTAQTAAEAAQAAAELAADNFDDTYLGSKSSDPTVDNDGGALNAGDLYFNTTDSNLKVYSGSAWQTAALDSSSFVETAGDTMTGNLSFGDDDKAIFGAGSDLQIYHTGGQSIIEDSGQGNLVILATDFYLNNSTNTENMITALNDGAVNLFYNNSQKLATTSTGIDVTGTVTADGLTVDGVGTITHDSSSDTYGLTVSASSDAAFSVLSTASPSRIALTTQSNHSTIKAIGGTSSSTLTLQTGAVGSPVDRLLINQFGDISFYEDTGTTAKMVWSASEENLGIGGASTFTSGTNIEVMDANVARLGFTNTSTNGSQWAWFAGTSGQAALYDYDNSRQAMTIDSSGNVGIGETSPDTSLDVVGGSADSVVDTLTLKNDSTGSSAGVGLNFVVDSVNDVITSAIYGQRTGAAYHQGSLQFLTKDNAGGGLLERMRIDSSGNLLVGTTDPNAHVSSSSGEGVAISAGTYGGYIAVSRSSGTNLVLNRQGTDGEIARFAKDGSTVGSIGNSGDNLIIGSTDVGLLFNSGANEILPATTSDTSDATKNLGKSTARFKDLYLSGGVYLGGTGSANKLDDYEEGTFTPTLGTTHGFTKGTVSGATGRYTKVGNLVSCFITFGSFGSAEPVVAGDRFNIGGLPFTPSDISSSAISGYTGSVHIYASIGSGNNATGIATVDDNITVWAVLNYNQGSIDYSDNVFLTVTYRTDA